MHAACWHRPDWAGGWTVCSQTGQERGHASSRSPPSRGVNCVQLMLICTGGGTMQASCCLKTSWAGGWTTCSPCPAWAVAGGDRQAWTGWLTLCCSSSARYAAPLQKDKFSISERVLPICHHHQPTTNYLSISLAHHHPSIFYSFFNLYLDFKLANSYILRV